MKRRKIWIPVLLAAVLTGSIVVPVMAASEWKTFSAGFSNTRTDDVWTDSMLGIGGYTLKNPEEVRAVVTSKWGKDNDVYAQWGIYCWKSARPSKTVEDSGDFYDTPPFIYNFPTVPVQDYSYCRAAMWVQSATNGHIRVSMEARYP